MNSPSPRRRPIGGRATFEQPSPQMAGGFEAADQRSRQLATWQPSYQSADAMLLPVKENLDAKSNDLVGNDNYVAAGANKWRDSIVGSQFKLNAKPAFAYLGLSADWAREFQDEVEMKFQLWAESSDHWVDASGRNTFTGLVRLAVGGPLYSHGEILATAEWIRDGRELNTAIQMVDPARLSNPPDKPESDMLRGGVEKNRWGRPFRYWIRNGHPHDHTSSYKSMTWKGVPAYKHWGRKQVIHILEQKRVDQTRGYSALVTALKGVRIRRQLTDLELQNVAINAMYAAVLETDLPSDVAAAVLGGDDIDSVTGDSAAYSHLVDQVQNFLGGKNLYLDGAKVPVIPPGTKLNMQRAAAAANSQFSFENSLLRGDARAMDMSFEEYTGDFTKTNFASAKTAMGETWRAMQAKHHMIASPFASDIYALWLEENISKGLIESLPAGFSLATFNQRFNKDALCTCTWLGAPKPELDPQKERLADRISMEDTTTTLEAVCAKQGKDWREVLLQIKRERDFKESIGLPDIAVADKTAVNNRRQSDLDDEEEDEDDDQETNDED